MSKGRTAQSFFVVRHVEPVSPRSPCSGASRSIPRRGVSRLGRRISIRSVERMVEKLRIDAGIKKPASCHSLRHSMATFSLELGGDITTISEILRHSSVAITQRYLHGLDGRRREVVRRLASTIHREIFDSAPLPANGSPDNDNAAAKNIIDVQGFWDDVDDAA
jgi:integrase